MFQDSLAFSLPYALPVIIAEEGLKADTANHHPPTIGFTSCWSSIQSMVLVRRLVLLFFFY